MGRGFESHRAHHPFPSLPRKARFPVFALPLVKRILRPPIRPPGCGTRIAGAARTNVRSHGCPSATVSAIRPQTTGELLTRERLPRRDRMGGRQRELPDRFRDRSQRQGPFRDPATAHKCVPLSSLALVVHERRRQRGWGVRRQRRSPSGKRCADGRTQDSTIECEILSQSPAVVDIFHPAVRDAQRNYHLELLRHHGLTRVRLQARTWEVAQGEQFGFRGGTASKG